MRLISFISFAVNVCHVVTILYITLFKESATSASMMSVFDDYHLSSQTPLPATKGIFLVILMVQLEGLKCSTLYCNHHIYRLSLT